MLKTIMGKLKRKKTMAQMLMWFNQSVAIINVMLQFLDIYRYRLVVDPRDVWKYIIIL